MFDEIINEFKNILSSDSDLSDVSFTEYYKSSARENVLVNNIVTIGVKGVEIKDLAFGKYLGLKNGNECFGKKGIITISLNIYVPRSSNGIVASQIFSKICNVLIFSDLDERILCIECGNTKFSKESGSYVLESFVKLDTVFAKQNQETNISNIIVRGEIG